MLNVESKTFSFHLIFFWNVKFYHAPIGDEHEMYDAA